MTALHSVKCSPLADLLERRLAMAYVFVLNSTEVGFSEVIVLFPLRQHTDVSRARPDQFPTCILFDGVADPTDRRL